MRILNQDKDEALNRITLYLTMDEARELRDSLESLLAVPLGHHEHVPSEDYNKEVTVCIYDTTFLDKFDNRSRKLINEDG